MSDIALSVVLPMYRTRTSVEELLQRLAASLEDARSVELVCVDDACPERSYEAVLAHDARRVRIVVCRHERNQGQLRAVFTGLAEATGELVAVMDADLQDAPEDLARLVARIQVAPMTTSAVAAGRRGQYEHPWREQNGRMYRLIVHCLTRGRIPADAGLFLVMRRAARDSILQLGDRSVHPLAALGRMGAVVESVPVVRRPRVTGSSSYRWWSRLAVACRSLAVLTPVYPIVRALGRRRPAVGIIRTEVGPLEVR